MIFKQSKVPDASNGSAVGSGLLQVCLAILDRAAELEVLLRSNTYPLRPIIGVSVSDDHSGGKDSFQADRLCLLSFRRELMVAELRLDGLLSVLSSVRGSVPAQLELLDGWFLRQLDRAISDFEDVRNPEASAGVRDLAINYLIGEEKFPFGEVFEEAEIKAFFQRLRSEVNTVIREIPR